MSRFTALLDVIAEPVIEEGIPVAAVVAVGAVVIIAIAVIVIIRRLKNK